MVKDWETLRENHLNKTYFSNLQVVYFIKKKIEKKNLNYLQLKNV